MFKIIKKIIPMPIKKKIYNLYEKAKYIPAYRKSIIEISKRRGLPIRMAIFMIQSENWNSFKTIYSLCEKNDDIQIKVYVFPKINYDGKLYLEDYKGICDFFSVNNIDYVEAYDEETGAWIDSGEIEADYLFYDEPYGTYTDEFSIENMFRRAKICYMPYGYSLSRSKTLYEIACPFSFFRLLYVYFPNDPARAEYAHKLFHRENRKFHHVTSLIFPRLDAVKMASEEYSLLDKTDYTVLWIPRFAMKNVQYNDPCGETSFFDFKDKILEAQNDNEINWIIRPHPQAFRNYVHFGVMSENEIQEYRNRIENADNAVLDEHSNYLEAFAKSNVLLADFSSLIVEYIATGKPIVYCGNPKAIPIDEFKRCLYIVSNWEEALSKIKDIKAGNDSLKEYRLKVASKLLAEGNASEKILKYIVSDYMSTRQGDQL